MSMKEKQFNPNTLAKIKGLTKCFWYRDTFYMVYANLLGVSREELIRSYPRENSTKYQIVDLILDRLVKAKDFERLKAIVSFFCQLDKPFDEADNKKYKEASRELKEFKEYIGTDPIKDELNKTQFEEMLKKKKEQDILGIAKQTKLDEIKQTFLLLSDDNNPNLDKQSRGYKLEELFYDLVELENIEHSRPYRTESEQIDGSVKFGSFDYLGEIKWTEEQMKQKDVSIFDGKIKGKGQSTRGIMLSISGFDISAINSAEGDQPRMIFIDSAELCNVLFGIQSLKDLLTSKIDTLARYGKVYKNK